MSKSSPPLADGADWNAAFAAVLRLVKARRNVLRDAAARRRPRPPVRAASPARTFFAEIERATTNDTK